MKKFINDTYLICKNDFLLSIKNPYWFLFGIFQPVVYLLFFFPFLKGIVGAPGFSQATPIQFFAPGLLIMTVILNASYSGMGLLDKVRSGFLERIRVTPVNRFSLALGFVLNHAILICIQNAALLIATIIFGLRPAIFGVILLFGLVIFIGSALTALSHALILITNNEDGLITVANFFTMPLILLAGVMLPLNFAPRFIQILSMFDPFTYAVSAARALLTGTFGDPVIWYAFGIFGILALVAIWWLKRLIQNAVA